MNASDITGTNEPLRLATLLFEDLDTGCMKDIQVGPGLNGRLMMTRWVIERLVSHPGVAELAICGGGTEAFPGTDAVSFNDITDWLSSGDVVWIEPARHYWWKPAIIREVAGRPFPIVTMMHSIGYAYQVAPLIASLATPHYPGDTIIAPSQVSARAFLEQCEGITSVLGLKGLVPNIEVIPYGVPSPPRIPYDVARTVLGWHEHPVLLFLGRLSGSDKANFDALFEAAARILSDGLHFSLVLAGAAEQGRDKELIARSAAFDLQRIVEVRPNVSEAEKHILLSGCDLFVSPANSVSESFGLSIVEAMMHARPVVCTAWSGYREIVRDGVDGLLVDTRWNVSNGKMQDLPFIVDRASPLSLNTAVDIHHLSHCLKLLIADPELRLRFGRAGRRRAMTHFLLDRTIAEIMAVLRNVHEACPNQQPPSLQTPTIASALGAYANRPWTSTEDLYLDDTAQIQRAVRSGALHTSKQFGWLSRARAGNKLSAQEEGTFELFRSGLLRIADIDECKE